MAGRHQGDRLVGGDNALERRVDGWWTSSSPGQPSTSSMKEEEMHIGTCVGEQVQSTSSMEEEEMHAKKMTKKKCVCRESNPGLLLGRQLS